MSVQVEELETLLSDGHDGQTLVLKIAGRLRDAIKQGHLQPGETIQSHDIASVWNVSRSPVREALHLLAGEGLLSIGPGFTVATLSRTDVLQLYELRKILEIRACSMAEDIVKDEVITYMRRILKSMDNSSEKKGDDWEAEWASGNSKFHLSLFVLSEGVNSQIFQIMKPKYYLLESHWKSYGASDDLLTNAHKEHYEIVDKLSRGELAGADGAEAVLSRHLENAKVFLLGQIAEDGADRTSRLLAAKIGAKL